MAKLLDLVGQRFSRLLVTKRAQSKKDGTFWTCLCDCGNIKTCSSSNLKSGNTTSCGCFHRQEAAKMMIKDITGLVFGRLTVICQSKQSRNHKTCWLCRCDCGNEIETTGYRLRSSQTRSCGCLQKERASQTSVVDRTGQVFGRLTVIRRVNHSDSATKWLCKCDCGNETIVSTGALQSTNTTSCGCARKDSVSAKYLADLTGKTIGRWTVLRRGNNRGTHSVYWVCLNSDGRVRERSAQTLLIESDPSRSFVRTCRTRIRAAFRKKSLCKTSSTANLLGCSGAELAEYLSALLTTPMTLDNHGSVWHIDHIIPIASFDLSNPEQVKKCFHYTNLQPLLIEHNLSKGDRLDWVHPNEQAINQGA